ncbi:MAG: GNAT family protein, partial [Planctomycetota bacterium]
GFHDGKSRLAWMDIAPLVLHGRSLRLEPLEGKHAADLAAVSEPDIFRYLLDRPAAADIHSLEDYIARQVSQPERIAFAIVDTASARAVGTSSYLNIRPAHRGLEIGHTWLARVARGTQVNPEAKFLLLRHAFETLGCLRVELKTDARNEQSQRAMVKLGCTREGLLRKHMVLPDGFVRDTVLFSIVETEWPLVREALTLRLGYTP